MKPLIITSGEPAGIGPDICLALANRPEPLVVVADLDILQQRARLLNLDINIQEYSEGATYVSSNNTLQVLDVKAAVSPTPGELNSANVTYVLDMLRVAAERTLQGDFSGIVTAPIHKGIINLAGVKFSGHTEFFAECCKVPEVVMMLASPAMKVALLTTHIPLKDVANAVTAERLENILRIIHKSFQEKYGIKKPRICVAGLNPHAGEGGYIGKEEIEVIIPTLNRLREQGLNLVGPLSADTMYIDKSHADADCFLAMYHDQGLPVLKYSGFSDSVNITLGLPIVRTSVDHGTALDLAGTGKANPSSLYAAIDEALAMQNC